MHKQNEHNIAPELPPVLTSVEQEEALNEEREAREAREARTRNRKGRNFTEVYNCIWIIFTHFWLKIISRFLTLTRTRGIKSWRRLRPSATTRQRQALLPRRWRGVDFVCSGSTIMPRCWSICKRTLTIWVAMHCNRTTRVESVSPVAFVRRALRKSICWPGTR